MNYTSARLENSSKVQNKPAKSTEFGELVVANLLQI